MNDLLCAMLFLLFFTFFFLTSKMCYTCLARQKPILPWKNNLSLYINDVIDNINFSHLTLVE